MKNWLDVLGGLVKTLIISGAAIVVIVIVALGILFGAVFF